MKKNMTYFLVIGIIICFVFVIIGNKMVSATVTTDLEKLAEAIKNEKGKITGWSLYTRETIDISSNEEWLAQVQRVKKQYPAYDWKLSTENDELIASGFSKKRDYVETIKILSTPTKNQPQSYLIYEVKGTVWNNQIGIKINKRISEKMEVLFKQKPVVFSCIKGEFSDKIDKVLSSKLSNLMTSLKAKEEEALMEKDFYSISAYSSKLEQSIPTRNHSMNMQIGLRKKGLGANTSIVIGTPIITIEY